MWGFSSGSAWVALHHLPSDSFPQEEDERRTHRLTTPNGPKEEVGRSL